MSVSVWMIDARGGTPRRVTPWRDRLLIVPWSFSPDGSRLAAVRGTGRRAQSIVSVSIPSGEQSLLVEKGREPTYSPDGSKIAFSREWRTGRLTRFGDLPARGGDLFVAASDGSWTRRLTFSPKRRETGPSWDPSGEGIAFTRYPARLTFEAQQGIGSSIVEINADGTCEHRILFTYGLSYRDAVWQPGAGRGAGRIEC